jgi:hypothetical protein
MTDKHARSLHALLLCALLGACADDAPEARIRAAIATLETAVEARSPGAALELLSADFSADGGQLDRAGMRAFLAGQLLGADRIEVVLGPIDVALHGERATAQFSALVSGGRYLGDRNEALQLRTGWRLEDGEWRCYLAERVDLD